MNKRDDGEAKGTLRDDKGDQEWQFSFFWKGGGPKYN